MSCADGGGAEVPQKLETRTARVGAITASLTRRTGRAVLEAHKQQSQIRSQQREQRIKVVGLVEEQITDRSRGRGAEMYTFHYIEIIVRQPFFPSNQNGSKGEGAPPEAIAFGEREEELRNPVHRSTGQTVRLLSKPSFQTRV